MYSIYYLCSNILSSFNDYLSTFVKTLSLMNRRNYLRLTMASGLLAIVSFPLVNWFKLGWEIDLKDLREKRDIIAELAEMIIPNSDTPGAKAASVQDYIISVVSECTNARQQHKFLSGLVNLDVFAIRTFGRNFLTCNAHEKHHLILYLSENERFSFSTLNRIEDKFFGKPFYVKLRELTVEGYCQSKLGATQGLTYNYIPGPYVACTMLNPHQKSWATK
jgi:hypothetical protein